MINYPSPQDYNEALQMPHLTLLDPQLAQGQVEVDSLGLPFGRTGAFAITFKVTTQGRDYAFRCFLQNRPTIHERYDGISEFLGKRPLPYFVDYRYLDSGIRVNGNEFPCLQMSWANGVPLGVYLDKNHHDQGRMTALQQQIQGLALALEVAGVAHGDIQGGNLLIGSGGEIKLVDYDGMFVPSLEALGVLENGHPNFQHPMRAKVQPFDATLDRFSFAFLHTVLGALIEDPSLWTQLNADPDKFLLGEVDFANPYTSRGFQALAALARTGKTAQALQAVASASLAEVPSFTDFLVGRSIPEGVKPLRLTTPGQGSRGSNRTTPWYLSDPVPQSAALPDSGSLGLYESATPLVDARRFSIWADTAKPIELVGQISRVDGRGSGNPRRSTRLWVNESGPYLCVDLRGQALEGFEQSGLSMDASLVGSWVSAKGLIEQTLHGDESSFSLVAEKTDSIEFLTPQQARWRLQSTIQTGSSGGLQSSAPASNSAAIASLVTSPSRVTHGATYPSSSPTKGNHVAGSIFGGSGIVVIIIGIIVLVLLAIFLIGGNINASSNNPATGSNQGKDLEELRNANTLCAYVIDNAPQALLDCNSPDANYSVDAVTIAQDSECSGHDLAWTEWGGVGTLCLGELGGTGATAGAQESASGDFELSIAENGKPSRWDICKGPINVGLNTESLSVGARQTALAAVTEALSKLSLASGFTFQLGEYPADGLVDGEPRGVNRDDYSAILISFSAPRGASDFKEFVEEWGSAGYYNYLQNDSWEWNYIVEAGIQVDATKFSGDTFRSEFGDLSALLMAELLYVSGLAYLPSQVQGELMGADWSTPELGPGDTAGLQTLADKECS